MTEQTHKAGSDDKAALLKKEARYAFDSAVRAFRKNQSAKSWNELELSMLALQQAASKFVSGHALAALALTELEKESWLDRKSASELIAEDRKGDPERYNIMRRNARVS